MTAERTAKAIVAGTWGCAGIVMAGSATNAYLAYGALGDNRALGLATGLAVDIGLCVALIGDRRLYAHGLSSNWGRALRITTAVMSLILNTAIALRDGHFLSAVMHAFLPILLVVLTEYGQDVLLKFTALGKAQDDADRPPVRPLDRTGPAVPTQPAGPVRPTLTAPFAPSGVEGSAQRTVMGSAYHPLSPDPLPDRSAPHPEVPRLDTVAAPRGGPTSEASDSTGTARPVATNHATTEVLRRDKPRAKPATRRPRQAKPATPEQRRTWVRHERDNGRAVTGADVHKQFPDSPRDGARIVRQVEAELDAELRAVATGGGR